jgi:hypothetical protein
LVRACRILGAIAVLAAVAPAGAVPSDDYLRGYADAVLRDVPGLDDYTLELREGRVSLTLRDARSVELDLLVRSLAAIDGVQSVEVLDREGRLLAAQVRDPVPAAAHDARAADSSGWDLFPPHELFEPLLADPRWPHFSAAAEWYQSDSELDRVADVSFGETFALLRSPESDHGFWEIGLQAGVFSVFDLDSESFDLVNSDFMVGASLTHQLGDLTSMLRFYHQSSHLGDEFLLRNRVDRVNLSYEVLDLLLSYDPFYWLRLYGGGGLLVHREPSDLDRWLAQAGIEIESPKAFVGGHLRPVSGVDLQFRDESDWRTDLSARLGIQVEHAKLRRLRLQLLAAYYRGRSPHGQFYNRRIETLGVGLHLGF